MSSLTREVEVYAVAARTATTTAALGMKVFQYDGFHSAHIVIVVSAVTATPSVVPSLQGVDALGNAYDVLVATAITATGTTVLKIGPGLIAIAGGVAADFLPRRWRLLMTHADTDSITYGVQAILFGGSNG